MSDTQLQVMFRVAKALAFVFICTTLALKAVPDNLQPVLQTLQGAALVGVIIFGLPLLIIWVRAWLLRVLGHNKR
jgi:hypothetical protein